LEFHQREIIYNNMKYLRDYNNEEMINEARWFELAVMRSEYNRDDELREFFLELVDLGGRILGIRNATHTLVDENFEIKNRIDYNNKPLYKAYTLRLRFEDLSISIKNGNTDKQMDSTIEFFNEFDDALMSIKDFGYKFKIKKIIFEPTMVNQRDGIMFDIVMYHPEDTIPWEHIFAPYEE